MAENEEENQPPPVTLVENSVETAAPSYAYLIHPERSFYWSTTRERTRIRAASRVYAIPPLDQPFRILSVTPTQRVALDYELTFLSRYTLHVRFGFSDKPVEERDGEAEGEEEQEQERALFPDDPSFPPSHMKEWLETGYAAEANDIDENLVPAGKHVMHFGVEVRGQDFNTFVRPHRKGGMEYQYVTDEDGNMGLEGFYLYDPAGTETSPAAEGEAGDNPGMAEKRTPLWKQNTRGPFSHSSMAPGVYEINGFKRCFELFELRPGENLHVRFDEGKALFFWTDRGWGFLMKNPRPVRIEWLARLNGPQIMLSLSTDDAYMEYIIVAGEALEKMKKEYAEEQKEQ